MKDISENVVVMSLLILYLVHQSLSAQGLPLYESDVTRPRDLGADLGDDEIANSQSLRQEDLRKLILKKMRFRDLEGEEEGIPEYTIKSQETKRNEDVSLAHKVAELLHGLKVRQVKSPKVRMPSLRFG